MQAFFYDERTQKNAKSLIRKTGIETVGGGKIEKEREREGKKEGISVFV